MMEKSDKIMAVIGVVTGIIILLMANNMERKLKKRMMINEKRMPNL